MRKPRPLATLQEVIITREKESATIAYRDSACGTSILQIGPEIAQMTDLEILDLYNQTLRAQAELARIPYVAVEIPLGSPQVEYSPECDQWVPRGHVLRCGIDDGGEDEEPVIEVDGREMTWHEFGRTICCFAGWGMRIEFVPEDQTHRRPKLVVREEGK